MTRLDTAWTNAEASLPADWSLMLRRVDGMWNAIAEEPWTGFLAPRHQRQTYNADPVVALRLITDHPAPPTARK